MTPRQEQQFLAIVAAERIRVDVMDALRALIEQIEDAAFDRGVDAAAMDQARWEANQ
jgi:hypothetical protein